MCGCLSGRHLRVFIVRGDRKVPSRHVVQKGVRARFAAAFAAAEPAEEESTEAQQDDEDDGNGDDHQWWGGRVVTVHATFAGAFRGVGERVAPEAAGVAHPRQEVAEARRKGLEVILLETQLLQLRELRQGIGDGSG